MSPNHWVERPAASFGWTVEAAAAHPCVSQNKNMPRPINQRDEFAEQYVAAVFADAKWSVYFPRKDKGFDFIVSKQTANGMIIRPVQVKGKFPESLTAVRNQYGYKGRLTALHADMVLAIPLFTALKRLAYPDCIAYMPFSRIDNDGDGEYSCEPARLQSGKVSAKPSFSKYFDDLGLIAMESLAWK